MATTRYAIAIKRSGGANPPSDWFERLSRIAGITMEGHTERGAQFSATPEAIAKVREEFSQDFHIEQVRERSPM